MSTDRLHRHKLFSETGNDWETVDDQHVIWRRTEKSLLSELFSVGHVRLLDWGPRDTPHPRKRLLGSLGDVLKCHSQ